MKLEHIFFVSPALNAPWHPSQLPENAKVHENKVCFIQQKTNTVILNGDPAWYNVTVRSNNNVLCKNVHTRNPSDIFTES